MQDIRNKISEKFYEVFTKKKLAFKYDKEEEGKNISR